MLHPNTSFYRLIFVSLSFTIYEIETSLDWDGNTKVSLNFAKILEVAYPAILALQVTKRQTLLSSLHWICLVPRLVCSIMSFKNCISIYILFTWQDDWSGAVGNKLHYIKLFLGDWQSYGQCSRDEVVLCRACISHTYLTHSYILRKEPPAQC